MRIAIGHASDGQGVADTFGVFEAGEAMLGVLCDGVGGGTAGQQAATLAVRTVAQRLGDGPSDVQTGLVEAIQHANRAIYESSRKSHRLMGMSTSIVAVVIRGDMAVVAHVGDSRAYLVRNGVARALTRDHTMVNMFVDNDLLSTEDAASHPEAHVLARALGGERQIDIDVHPVLQLQDGDSLLLCSSGVHRALSDADLAMDWVRPEQTARQLLRRVAARGGSDGSRLVGLRVGGRGEPGMSLSRVPEIEQGGDHLTPSSSDMVHASELLEDMAPPVLYPISADDEPTHDPDEPTTEMPGAPLLNRKRSATPRPLPRTPTAPTNRPKEAPRRRTPKRAVLVAAGVAGLCLVGLAAAVAYPWSVGTPSVVAKVVTPPPRPPEPLDPDNEVVLPPAPVVSLADIELPPPSEGWISLAFPDLPPNTKTSKIFDTVPSSPEYRIRISKLLQTEGAGCRGIEEIVTRALRDSTDNAGLYHDLWLCFEDRQHPLVARSLSTHLDFSEVQPHLEGSPEQPSAQARLPPWYLAATDGIERRMDLYAEHARFKGRYDLFDEVARDAIDLELIAATFSHDLQAEAAYATAFRDVRNPSKGDTQHWARRVHAVRRHLDSPVGRLVREVYPESHARMATMLTEATYGLEARVDTLAAANRDAEIADLDWQGLAAEQGVPVEVAQALLVAAEKLPRPDAVPTPPPPPPPPPPPECDFYPERCLKRPGGKPGDLIPRN